MWCWLFVGRGELPGRCVRWCLWMGGVVVAGGPLWGCVGGVEFRSVDGCGGGLEVFMQVRLEMVRG